MVSVKLHGAFPSPFSLRVIWVLKLKGIHFDYIEENLLDKSPELLKYNPIHKKIPVFVHNGQPICESMVIVEYIDETWPEKPLLPLDPLERANAKFWVKFLDEKSPVFVKLLMSTGEELKTAKKETLQYLQTIEEHALADKKFFGGKDVGYLDIAFGLLGRWIGVFEQISGLEISLESEKLPRLQAWVKNFECHPVIQESLPDRDRMISFYTKRREMMLSPPPS